MSKEAAYFLLLGLTYDLLPRKDFANQMILKGSTIPSPTLQMIREGRNRDLKALVHAVQVLVPEFVIPIEILTVNSNL